MKDQFEKYLPLGTIIKIEQLDHDIMILGYLVKGMLKKDRIYDYMGCLYPEGVIATDNSIVFNHEDIKEILELGFVSSEQKKWNEKMHIYSENYSKKSLDSEDSIIQKIETLE